MSTQPTLTPSAFVEKWRGVTTTEKASSQSHFIDLCRMLGEPTPHEADPTGEHYAFERRVTKGGGGDGFADVWKRGFFAWDSKGKKADLMAAYKHLLDYREDLENPPLLIVSDLQTIEIRTNFMWLSHTLFAVTLDDLAADNPSEALAMLRAVFRAPGEFRPRLFAGSLSKSPRRPDGGDLATDKAVDHPPDAQPPRAREWWQARPEPSRITIPKASTAEGARTRGRPPARLKDDPAIRAVRVREAELDRRWQAKKDRTRNERDLIERTVAEARERAKRSRDPIRTRQVPTGEVRPTKVKASGDANVRRPRTNPNPPLDLATSAPKALPARPEPIVSGSDKRCPHGMSKSNCAHCHPGRYLPPIKTRR